MAPGTNICDLTPQIRSMGKSKHEMANTHGRTQYSTGHFARPSQAVPNTMDEEEDAGCGERE